MCSQSNEESPKTTAFPYEYYVASHISSKLIDKPFKILFQLITINNHPQMPFIVTNYPKDTMDRYLQLSFDFMKLAENIFVQNEKASQITRNFSYLK